MIASQGYEGGLLERGWSNLIGRHAGVDTSVLGTGDWKASAVPNADRTISVAASVGQLACCGVFNTSDAAVTVQSPSVASGARWDLISAYHDWTYTDPAHTDPVDVNYVGGKTTIRVITGGTDMALPASRESTPGYKYDAPIALVQYAAGASQPRAIVDLRVRLIGGVGHVASADAVAVYRAADSGFAALIDQRGPDYYQLPDVQRLVTQSTPTASSATMISRDPFGRAQVANPAATADIANKNYVDGIATTITNRLSATITDMNARVPFAYSNASLAAPWWAGYVGYARIGPMVFVEVDLVRSDSAQFFNAWVPTLIAGGLPKAATGNINNGEALTNQAEAGFAFSMNGTSLNLLSRYTSKNFAVGGWVNGSFAYIAG